MKMLLAYVYDSESDDVSSCRKIIDSIDLTHVTEFEELPLLKAIWEAKILRDEKKYDLAETKLIALSESETVQRNWYAHFSSKNILAILYLKVGRFDDAEKIHSELKQFFKGKKLQVTQRALQLLETEIRQTGAMGTVVARIEAGIIDLTFGKQRHRIQIKKDVERLFQHFLKAKYSDRSDIMAVLQDRSYVPKKDDKTIYYYVHQLRKYLASLGFPEKALVLEGTGYRFIPEVKCEIV